MGIVHMGYNSLSASEVDKNLIETAAICAMNGSVEFTIPSYGYDLETETNSVLLSETPVWVVENEQSVLGYEYKQFDGCRVYLTNKGLGVFLDIDDNVEIDKVVIEPQEDVAECAVCGSTIYLIADVCDCCGNKIPKLGLGKIQEFLGITPKNSDLPF